MKHLALGMTALLLAGCGPKAPQPAARPSAASTATASVGPIDRITGSRHQQWGSAPQDWEIDRTGRVRITYFAFDGPGEGKPLQPVPPAPLRKSPVTRTIRFTAPPGSLDALRRILAGVEDRARRGLDCPEDSTDQGYSFVEFHNGKAHIGYSLSDTCTSPDRDPMTAAIDAAERQLSAWSLAATDRKIIDKPA